MRRTLGVLVGLTLLLVGCTPPTTSSPAASSGSQGQAQTSKSSDLDTLAGTKKLVMTTKITSDMPNSWEFDGADATAKMQKLLGVLKQGTPMQNGAVDSQHVVPSVMFIIDANGNKNVINVYDDRFQFGANWYKLDNATDRTYGSINKIEGEKVSQ